MSCEEFESGKAGREMLKVSVRGWKDKVVDWEKSAMWAMLRWMDWVVGESLKRQKISQCGVVRGLGSRVRADCVLLLSRTRFWRRVWRT